MFLAPKLDIMISCRSIWILPQVKVEMPIRRLRKHFFLRCDLKLKLADDLSSIPYNEIAAILTRLDIRRDPACKPDALGLHRVKLHPLQMMVDAVSDHNRIAMRLLRPLATSGSIAEIAVTDDICNKAGPYILRVYDLPVGSLEVCDLEIKIHYRSLCPDYSLGKYSLTPPAAQLKFLTKFKFRKDILLISYVYIAP